MGSDAVWPLPSESRRVRTLLYLSEGTVVGAGGLLLVVRFAGSYLVDVGTGSFDPGITAFGAFILVSLLLFGLRTLVITRVATPTRDKLPEYRDWSETRKWRWVAAVALLVGGLLSAVAVLRWTLWQIVFSQGFDLLLLGTGLAGILLYIYVLHRLGI